MSVFLADDMLIDSALLSTFHEAKMFVAVNAISMASHFAALEKDIKDNVINAGRIFNLDGIGVTQDEAFEVFSQRRCVLPPQKTVNFNLLEWASIH